MIGKRHLLLEVSFIASIAFAIRSKSNCKQASTTPECAADLSGMRIEALQATECSGQP
jgi:hypothetical protein